MKVHGFQKLTLLDFPKNAACTVFTGGCNFKCPFCHNALLVTQIDEASSCESDEIIDFLKKRVGLLDGVCITGGEPLLQRDIENFIVKIKSMGFKVKLDTNGSFPEKLKDLIEKNLVDYVAIDIKNSKEKYAQTIGLSTFDLAPLQQSIDLLISGNIDYEFRTTVVKQFHTNEDIEKICNWIKGAKHYYLQSFVDSGNLIGKNLCAVEKPEMLKMLETAKKIIPSAELRGI